MYFLRIVFLLGLRKPDDLGIIFDEKLKRKKFRIWIEVIFWMLCWILVFVKTTLVTFFPYSSLLLISSTNLFFLLQSNSKLCFFLFENSCINRVCHFFIENTWPRANAAPKKSVSSKLHTCCYCFLKIPHDFSKSPNQVCIWKTLKVKRN